MSPGCRHRKFAADYYECLYNPWNNPNAIRLLSAWFNTWYSVPLNKDKHCSVHLYLSLHFSIESCFPRMVSWTLPTCCLYAKFPSTPFERTFPTLACGSVIPFSTPAVQEDSLRYMKMPLRSSMEVVYCQGEFIVKNKLISNPMSCLWRFPCHT